MDSKPGLFCFIINNTCNSETYFHKRGVGVGRKALCVEAGGGGQVLAVGLHRGQAVEMDLKVVWAKL